MTVGFVTALAWEQQLLRRSLPAHCLVELSGMGATAAAAAAQRLLQRGAGLLVSSGCCAGLDARLRCGDIVLADQICNESDQTVCCGGDHLAIVRRHLAAMFCPLQEPSISPDQGQHAGPDKAASNHYAVGKLVSVSTPIFDTAGKQHLAAQHVALAADMESFAVAQVALAAGAPFLALRVVLDDCRQSLPPSLTASCNTYGQARPVPLLQACLRRPTMLRELAMLARSRNHAVRSLRQAFTTWPKELSSARLGPVYTNPIVTVAPERVPIEARGTQFGDSK